MFRLLPPAGEVGFLGDAAIPADLYFVARAPVALVGMGYPVRIDWQLLHANGVDHVVCLTHDAPPYDCAPLTITAIALEDQFARNEGPTDPEREAGLVRRAAEVVLDVARSGRGVAVHCRGGRGRVGAVIGSALVMSGHDPHVVITHFDRLHRIRGKGGWPETPWQAEVVRTTRRAGPTDRA